MCARLARADVQASECRGGGKNWREGKMDKVTKATLTLLIAEIQDCQDMAEVNRVLDSWIKANGIHPEKVGTFDVESGWVKHPGE